MKSFQKFAGRGTLIQLREWTKEFVDARVLCEVTVGSPPRTMLCHVDHIELLKQAQQDASIPDKLQALPMRMVPAFDAVTIVFIYLYLYLYFILFLIYNFFFRVIKIKLFGFMIQQLN